MGDGHRARVLVGRGTPVRLIAAAIWVTALSVSSTWGVSADNGVPRPGRAEESTATEWPDFQFDLGNSGHNPLELLVGADDVANLQLSWDTNMNDFINGGSSPIVALGRLYAAVHGGQVFAFDPSTGGLLWGTSIEPGFGLTGPAVSEGVLVVGSADSNVYSLDAATGDRQWTFDTGFGVFGSPAILNGVVYIGSNDDNLYALDLHTGDLVWQRNLGFATGPMSPAIADDVVYVSTVFTHKVFALDAATGQKRWSRKLTGGYVGSGPVVYQGRVFVTTDRGFLLSLDASTGEVLWRVKGLGDDLRHPAVAGEVVYVGSSLNGMVAVEAATGALVWRTNGVVYAGGRENKLYAFDAAIGDLLWTASAGALVSNPILVNGHLYFGSFDNHLYAYTLT
jgi:outer membrane protein assembly factor BamB